MYWNYYIDEFGRKAYLRDVDFTQYDQLSDVGILHENKRAIFKYDEELHFEEGDPNKYYPTLNFKFPRTKGLAASDKMDDLNLASGQRE